MLDVDYFKKINDTYGHLVGDAVLKEVAQVIRENVRQIDIIGRWGGEELAVVFAEAGPGQGRFAAERLRQAVEGREICAYDEKLKATVSIGIAGFPRDAKEIQPLIEKADQALYRAKEAGRNKVFG
jgi:diguanylate cyclase (GGDEF)-like protein